GPFTPASKGVREELKSFLVPSDGRAVIGERQGDMGGARQRTPDACYRKAGGDLIFGVDQREDLGPVAVGLGERLQPGGLVERRRLRRGLGQLAPSRVRRR